jgi:secreted trypsin-like serine protease
VCKGELTGVLSHSVSCGKQNKPSVYTDVASHKIWIQQAINSTAALTIMSYVRILAMLTALASLWSCRT